MGILIDLFRRSRQFAIHLGYRSGSRCIQIGNRFHRLHRAENLARGDLGASLRQFDEHDVAERILRMAA